MTHTLTIHLTEELEQWLDKVSRETGIPKSTIVRDHLERARNDKKPRLAGTINGAPGLSSRKGSSRK